MAGPPVFYSITFVGILAILAGIPPNWFILVLAVAASPLFFLLFSGQSFHSDGWNDGGIKKGHP